MQRDYTDVRDVVRAYVDILEKGKAGKAYNVCSGKGYKLSDLLDKYRSLIDRDVEIVSDKSRMRPVDIPILIGSYEKLSADTGWEPTIPIETTLSDSLKFWRHHLAVEVEEN